jgi:hypothetical protein
VGYYVSESRMDDYDNEEMAFCEESHELVGKAIEEDESEFLQAVFDEENALFRSAVAENGFSVATIRKQSLSNINNSKKNVRRSTASTKREAWIVNPKLMAKRNLCSSAAFVAEKNLSPDDHHVPQKNPCQEVSKAIKIEEDLSCENGSKSSKKMGSLQTSKKKIKVNNNLINSNNNCTFCGKEFCKDKLLKNHAKKCGCNENYLKDCELCIEKFAKRSPLGSSWKLDHNYSKSENVLQCNLCGLNFSQTNFLQVHLRTEHVLKLREILKNCFHVETRNDLKEDNLIVQVLPERRQKNKSQIGNK